MKQKELINDSRLTPTMERVRSGRTQLFRERNPNDRTFISKDNCDVSLEHADKAMYAELTDGQWYWVSGCAECNGKPRDWMSYIECEKHDVCSCCGASRKEISGPAWGGRNGWTCDPCYDARKLEVRRRVFEKLGNERPDTSCCDEVTCPHCGTIHSDSAGDGDDIECYVCEGEFTVEVSYSPIYSTTVKGKRITQ